MNYINQHALVLGLGESGLAVAQWLLYCGARVRVADTRGVQAVMKNLSILRLISKDSEFIGHNIFSVSLLDDIDFIIVSPGLSPAYDLEVLTTAIMQRSIPIWSEVELFAQTLIFLRKEYAYVPKVLAITGTNGKTTVASLTHMLCRRAGLRSVVAGNIGPAILEVLRQELIKDNKQDKFINKPHQIITKSNLVDVSKLPEVWILELSSFQLHATYNLQADVATILNITQDHLDWHGDMTAYVADKAKIFGKYTVRVLNRNDVLVMKMVNSGVPIVTFGSDKPDKINHFGLVNIDNQLWLSHGILVENNIHITKNEYYENNQRELTEFVFLANRLIPVDMLKIRGLHNIMNALAAIALCHAIHLPLITLLKSLCDYTGEPHRIEFVTNIRGVDYYNDSKGTNVAATVAALNSLGSDSKLKCLLLIIGGDGKKQNFTPLIVPLKKYVRVVLLIGQEITRVCMRDVLMLAEIELIECATLEEAVLRANKLAQAGDIVLLSPACASLDMFHNYVHRAQVFITAVHKLAVYNTAIMSCN